MDNRKQLFWNASICKSSPWNPEIVPSLALYSTYKLDFHCSSVTRGNDLMWSSGVILMHVYWASWVLISALVWQDFIWKDLMNKQEWDKPLRTNDQGWVHLKCVPRVLAGGPPACFLDCDKHESRFRLSGSILSGWFTHQWFVLKNTFPWISVLRITAVRQACPQLAEQDDFTWV